MWIYWRNGTLFEVGHYRPDGVFILESKHKRFTTAADRVRFLNGGARPPTTPYTVIEIGTSFTITFD